MFILLGISCQWVGSMPKPRKSAFEPEYRQIIAQLVARRDELGLTRTQLGERYGEDQSFIGRVERLQSICGSSCGSAPSSNRSAGYHRAALCAAAKNSPLKMSGEFISDIKALFREEFDPGFHEVYHEV